MTRGAHAQRGWWRENDVLTKSFNKCAANTFTNGQKLCILLRFVFNLLHQWKEYKVNFPKVLFIVVVFITFKYYLSLNKQTKISVSVVLKITSKSYHIETNLQCAHFLNLFQQILIFFIFIVYSNCTFIADTFKIPRSIRFPLDNTKVFFRFVSWHTSRRKIKRDVLFIHKNKQTNWNKTKNRMKISYQLLSFLIV